MTRTPDKEREWLGLGVPPTWADHWGQDRYGVFASFVIGGVAQRMRWIRPGSFVMGSPADEPGRWADESPQHRVHLSAGFWIADTPCTQALWQVVMGDNPSRFQSPRRPIEQVSWDDVQEFLERLNQQRMGLDVVLPTEVQWEYACRAGTTTATYAGPMEILGENNAPILDDIAWYGGNSGLGFELDQWIDSSGWRQKQHPHERAGTRDVGLKRPNDWGLYDMLGNVWEWCANHWYHYSNFADPVDPASGVKRVIRGGSWGDDARGVRAAFRYVREPGSRLANLGFRLVRGQGLSPASASQTRPGFQTGMDAELTERVYRRVPTFAVRPGTEQTSWRATHHRMIHPTADSSLFHTADVLERGGWKSIANWKTLQGETMLPMYEAKMFHLFNHRFCDYSDNSEASRSTALQASALRLEQPTYTVTPRYWINSKVVRERIRGRWKKTWFLAWRDICRSSDSRTVIVSVLPYSGVGSASPLIFTHERGAATLVANFSSFALDYIARQIVSGVHLTFRVLNQLPILPPATYDVPTPWHPSQALAAWILPRVLELTYTAWDLIGFARDHGYDGPPYRWNEERRFWLRAELDAAYFHLYGLVLDEVDHVMESFRLVRHHDDKVHNSYRTKQAILDIYQRMADATAKGHEYLTVLDPPPADPAVAHPPLTPDRHEKLAPILERSLDP